MRPNSLRQGNAVETLKRGYEEDNDDIRFFEKNSVICLCPKCGKTHKLKFLWTGNGTPRKFCHRCREAIGSVDDALIYEASPDLFRSRGGSATID